MSSFPGLPDITKYDHRKQKVFHAIATRARAIRLPDGTERKEALPTNELQRTSMLGIPLNVEHVKGVKIKAGEVTAESFNEETKEYGVEVKLRPDEFEAILIEDQIDRGTFGEVSLGHNSNVYKVFNPYTGKTEIGRHPEPIELSVTTAGAIPGTRIIAQTKKRSKRDQNIGLFGFDREEFDLELDIANNFGLATGKNKNKNNSRKQLEQPIEPEFNMSLAEATNESNAGEEAPTPTTKGDSKTQGQPKTAPKKAPTPNTGGVKKTAPALQPKAKAKAKGAPALQPKAKAKSAPAVDPNDLTSTVRKQGVNAVKKATQAKLREQQAQDEAEGEEEEEPAQAEGEAESEEPADGESEADTQDEGEKKELTFGEMTGELYKTLKGEERKKFQKVIGMLTSTNRKLNKTADKNYKSLGKLTNMFEKLLASDNRYSPEERSMLSKMGKKQPDFAAEFVQSRLASIEAEKNRSSGHGDSTETNFYEGHQDTAEDQDAEPMDDREDGDAEPEQAADEDGDAEPEADHEQDEEPEDAPPARKTKTKTNAKPKSAPAPSKSKGKSSSKGKAKRDPFLDSIADYEKKNFADPRTRFNTPLPIDPVHTQSKKSAAAKGYGKAPSSAKHQRKTPFSRGGGSGSGGTSSSGKPVFMTISNTKTPVFGGQIDKIATKGQKSFLQKCGLL